MSDILSRRTYKESYFWAFVACVILTILMNKFGISMQQVTDYSEDILKKTFENINSLMIWIVPMVMAIKNELNKWRESMHKRDVEVAKIKQGIIGE